MRFPQALHPARAVVLAGMILSIIPSLASHAIAQTSLAEPAWLPSAYQYDKPIYPDANYDEQIPAPKDLLGFPLGSRPARHAQIERCFQAWAKSERLTLVTHGFTYEHRPLYHAIITSPENHARIDAIRSAIGALADPRKLSSDAEAERIIRQTPAIAWLGHSIHGDELSGADAALALAYYLVASRRDDVAELLDNLVVIIDPMLNPDGRDRFITQTDEFQGTVPSLDTNSMQHAGRWPRGRTNHYYFDLNRDWILGVNPETRGRRAVIVRWNPQLVTDAHEMGSDDTYLFYPPRAPFNPNTSPLLHKWWKTFADEQGAAFDAYGWSYYTREWADFWYPGYTDGWGAMQSAVGILYEQAGTGGRPIRQSSGAILTYREAVHHHAVSSLSNIKTLAGHRREVLQDFLAQKRAALAADDARPATFLFPPGPNTTRTRALLDNLANQGIEIEVATSAFSAKNLTNTLGETAEQRDFPAGTYLVQRRQPRAALAGALLDFDPRMSDEFLTSERRELETRRRSRIYDITAWCLPMAAGLEAYWTKKEVHVTHSAYARAERSDGGLPITEHAYAYAIDSSDDSWERAAAFLLQAGVKVRAAERRFNVADRSFPTGSLLIRAHENDRDLTKRLRQAAEFSGAAVYSAATARSSDDTPDLGGQHFLLLERPRVALLSGSPTSTNSMGSLWHAFDQDLGLGISLIDAAALRGDLRRYNVIVLPSLFGSAERLLAPVKSSLKQWVRGGGTLIAIGNVAAKLAREDSGLSAVRLRRDMLDDLGKYASAVALERQAGRTPVAPRQVWDTPTEHVPPGANLDKPETELNAKALDEWRRIFSPVGVIVRGRVNQDHWLAWGLPAELPLHCSGSNVFLAKYPVQAPLRYAAPTELRLSGLLWPEAGSRLGDSAYVTVEKLSRGQVLLLAQEPNFRGAWAGTRRLLINAVLLGPGCGTSPPAP